MGNLSTELCYHVRILRFRPCLRSYLRSNFLGIKRPFVEAQLDEN